MAKFGEPGAPARGPGGRPREDVRVKDLARKHTEAAIEALVNALADARTAVPAAIALLDRGWGKAPQALTGEDGNGPAEVVMKIITGVPRYGSSDGDES